MSSLAEVAPGAQPDAKAVNKFDPHRNGGVDLQPGIAAPSHAEYARTLVEQSGRATLSTIARDPSGYPFGSLVTYAPDDTGAPWMLISSMAEHTQNALVDMRASIMIAEQAVGDVDPLSLGRVSLIGVLVCDDPTTAMCDSFVERHPGAKVYLDFSDFSWWRLEVVVVRYVGGFGRMSWVDLGDYSNARPDPIAPSAVDICAHMNADHAEAQLALLKHFNARPDLIRAVMTSVDRFGCEFTSETPNGSLALRLAFPKPVNSSGEVRQTLISMLREAQL
jgi:heme iron utilization protein